MNNKAFTMIELMVVMTVIIALAGIGFPVYNMVRVRSQVNATQATIQALAVAIAAQPRRTWSYSDSTGNPVNRPLFNVNSLDSATGGSDTWGDVDIDGDPDPNGNKIVDPVGSTANAERNASNTDGMYGLESDFNLVTTNATNDLSAFKDIVASGYRGALYHLSLSLPANQVNIKKQPIDAWKKPLHLRWDSSKSWPGGFRIWSNGPNKIDNSFPYDPTKSDNTKAFTFVPRTDDIDSEGNK